MTHEIKSTTGVVLYSCEAESLRQCVAIAVSHDTNLRGTNLRGADLRGADLSGTHLRGADLRGADLINANLRGTNLSGTNLRGADLRGTYLSGADLSGADLSGTCLDPDAALTPASDKSITSAGMRIDGDYVYGWRTETSRHCGSTIYESGQEYVAPVFSVSAETDCHPGIYLHGEEWLEMNYADVPLVEVHCLRNEILQAGDKFRCKRLWVL